ncbi:MAG TPA: sensor histidine kinase [Bosea sp. (in: a-proteobacteria)]|jgi:two-component sensor histidine kinase|nr:sensor histidine kinase [Bosea sp. (in: a-proteobacteria)]
MALSLFRTVRGRLLALMVAIVLPIACLTAAAAVATYRTVFGAIETSQMRAADDFAVRARVWYRGALRSLVTSAAAIRAMSPASESCDRIAEKAIAAVSGYEALLLRASGQPDCIGGLDGSIPRGELTAVASQLATRLPIKLWGGTEFTKARYDQVRIAGRSYLAIYSEFDGGDALLLTKPDPLDDTFDLGSSDKGMMAALLRRGGDVVVARGGAQADASWLPKAETVPEPTAHWAAPSRAGPSRSYAARMVAEPDLYVVASFDGSAERAATTQFYILLLAPLLTLALLGLVYMKAIDQHCVRWLRGIEATARARSSSASARVPLSGEMPRDIRSVAEAFNAMVDEQEVRQSKLRLALDDNRFLVRELHHRVKNSLQVVQSYIGLTKRDHQGEARMALSDAECRVHVLSAAYRFTLADGEMQPVRIDLFLDDVVAMVSSLILARGQRLESRIETQAALPIDRIIPLGFLIVDVASRALRAAPGIGLELAVTNAGEGVIDIAITTDRDTAQIAPPRLFAGLLMQIEAIEIGPPQGRSLGVWRLSHGITQANDAAQPHSSAGVISTPTLSPTKAPAGPI